MRLVLSPRLLHPDQLLKLPERDVDYKTDYHSTSSAQQLAPMLFQFFITVLSTWTNLLLPSVFALPGLVDGLGNGGGGLTHLPKMPIPLPAALVPEFYPLVRLTLSPPPPHHSSNPYSHIAVSTRSKDRNGREPTTQSPAWRRSLRRSRHFSRFRLHVSCIGTNKGRQNSCKEFLSFRAAPHDPSGGGGVCQEALEITYGLVVAILPVRHSSPRRRSPLTERKIFPFASILDQTVSPVAQTCTNPLHVSSLSRTSPRILIHPTTARATPTPPKEHVRRCLDLRTV